MDRDDVVAVIAKLEEVIESLRQAIGDEEGVAEEIELDQDRILPSQEELDTIDDAEVEALLKSFAVDGAEVKGTARCKRQALKALVAELEGDDLETKWSNSILKLMGTLLNTKPSEAEVLLAIQERADAFMAETPVPEPEEEEESEEEEEEPEEEAAESADFELSEGDTVTVTLPDPDTGEDVLYDGVVLDPDVDGMVQVKVTDGEEEDVIDVPVSAVAPCEMQEEFDLTEIFSEEKISEVSDRVMEFSEAELVSNIGDYIESLTGALENAQQMDADEDTLAWLQNMKTLMEADLEDNEIKALFYLAAFFPDDGEEFVAEDTPAIIDGKLFCNGVPMGTIDDAQEFVVEEDFGEYHAGDVLGETSDMIPCVCFVSVKGWAYDIASEGFVALVEPE